MYFVRYNLFERSMLMKKILLSFACLIIALSVIPINHLTYTYVDANENDYTVNASVLNLREGPGLTYPIVKELKQNDAVTKIETKGDWIKVTAGTHAGWVASWLIKSTKTTSTEHKQIIAQVDHLNIRKEPSLSSSVLSQLFTGQKAVYIQQSGDWVQIEFEKVKGWVSLKYVAIEDNASKASDENNEHTVSDKTQYFTVSVNAVNIRKKPDLSAEKLGTVKSGQQFEVLNQQGNWIEIEYEKNNKGWVYSFYGTFSGKKETTQKAEEKNTSKKTIQIIYEGTNLREQPSTNSAVVKRVNIGETFEVINTSNDWYEIKVDNKKAYVANWVVKNASSSKDGNKDTKKANRKKGTLNGLTIVIDPGHGGNDHGTTGIAKNTAEKTINLLTAELLTSKLRSAGAEVILTRESDTYVELRKRVSIATQNTADAFISIHYDATEQSSVNGFTTYYTKSTQKSLANAVHKGLASNIKLRDRGVQAGNYLVLRENTRPAILLELGYLSNRDEERTVSTDYFREQATQGIYTGLLNYFDAQLK